MRKRICLGVKAIIFMALGGHRNEVANNKTTAEIENGLAEFMESEGLIIRSENGKLVFKPLPELMATGNTVIP